MSAPLVGVIGKKRAGKDTFASRLVGAHGFERVAFADPVKATALAIDPFIEVLHFVPGCSEPGCCGDSYEYEEYERLSEIVKDHGWEGAKEVADVRRILQEVGTGIRSLDRDFWICAASQSIERARNADVPVVITDVRFRNEAEMVRENGGVLVRVTRPSIVSGDTHVSEVDLDDYEADYTVSNNGLVEHLFNYADQVAVTLAVPGSVA